MKLKKIIGAIIVSVVILGCALGVCFATDVFVSTYTITFDSNGGEPNIFLSLEVEKGSTIKLPTATKTGYTLNGWYNEKEMWTEQKVVKSNMTLKARWDANIYQIAFKVDDKTYYEYVKYGDMPVFSSSTHKESTINEQFTFVGWEPQICVATQNTTYRAVYHTDVREYNVNLSLSHASAGVISGSGKYDYNTTANFSVTPNVGYEFIGWYNLGDDSLFSTNSSITINNISSDYNLIAKFNVLTKTINFVNTKSANNLNKTSYDIRDGEFDLIPLSKNGYNFLGFYDGESAGANKIEKIDSSVLVDITLYAKWEIVSYSIIYELNGGENHAQNPSSYTIETQTFTLYEPTKLEDSFLGWSGTGLNKTTKIVTVPNGSFGDLKFSAVWSGGAKTISFVANGESLDELTILANPGDVICTPSLDGANYGMGGYSVLNWYTEEDELFNFTTMPADSLVLYGKWSYVVNQGFIPYLSKFQLSEHSYYSPMLINSYFELVALVEYLQFYNLNEDYNFKINYKSCSSSEVRNEMDNALNDCIFPINKIIYTNVYSNGIAYFSFDSYDLSNEYNLKIADKDGNYTYNQYNAALAYVNKSPRGNDFNNFNINKVSETLVVRTSNQLVYALEIGLKPIPEVGSPAEIVYNKAKEILRSICSDNMDDTTKARVIYEYLIKTVEYDNFAVNNLSIKNNWEEYSSWYAEGALINGVAVCDGIAKAYLILAKIENIPTIRVNSIDHAWNKIYIQGGWYGVDATHGNILLSANETEILSYTSFMFTDSYKTNKNNIALNYNDKQANEVYNYYENSEYTNSSSQTFDLYLNSEAEFILLLSYIKNETIYASLDFMFEVVFDYSYNLSIIYSYFNASYVSTVTMVDSAGNSVVCIIVQ